MVALFFEKVEELGDDSVLFLGALAEPVTRLNRRNAESLGDKLHASRRFLFFVPRHIVRRVLI
jgi:hypothetical protein